MNNIVAFRITGEFAHFRSPFVTSYLFSYPFPPKPTVLGMLGAMMGYSPVQILDLQNKVKIGIKLNKPPKKVLDYVTLWKFEKDGRIQLSPVEMELLVKPDYTIFVHSSDHNFISALSERLEKREFVYPVSLGKNEFIGVVRRVFSYDSKEVKLVKTSTIDSVIPISTREKEITPLDLATSNWAVVEIVPTELEVSLGSNVRRIKRTGCFVYSLNGKSINLRKKVDSLMVGSWKVITF